MMRDTGKRRQLNNQGMTLVEVLVAMIIISVIGVAFLQSFSYAVKTNRLAKQKQEALSIAQTMMEAAKAYSVEEMDAGLSGLVFSSGTYSVNGSGDYKVADVNGTDYDVKMKLTAGTAGASGIAVHDMEQLQNPSWETDGRFVQDINDEMQKILEHAYNSIIADPSTDEAFLKVKNFLINGLILLHCKMNQLEQKVIGIHGNRIRRQPHLFHLRKKIIYAAVDLSPVILFYRPNQPVKALLAQHHLALIDLYLFLIIINTFFRPEALKGFQYTGTAVGIGNSGNILYLLTDQKRNRHSQSTSGGRKHLLHESLQRKSPFLCHPRTVKKAELIFILIAENILNAILPVPVKEESAVFNHTVSQATQFLILQFLQVLHSIQ